MQVPVVITEQEFQKGEPFFREQEEYQWVVTAPAEEEVAKTIEASGARIAVLGTAKYQGALYEALGRNAKEKALIVRYGVGYDGIDLSQCGKHGALLAITKGALDESVAEHTIALLLSLARNVPHCHGEMMEGRFARRTGFEVWGKTLGLIGFGSIAKRVARIASAGLGMRVLAFGKTPLEQKAAQENLSPEEYLSKHQLDGYYTDFDEFTGWARVLSLHLPVTPDTSPFLTRERIAYLSPGTYLINTGRGKLVDEEALYEALASGVLAGAAIDVFTQEPYVPVSPEKDLRLLPNVVLTPHIASDTVECNRRMQELILRNINDFLAGRLDKLTLAPGQSY